MWFARLLGLFTFLYGVVALVRPRVLTIPVGATVRSAATPPPISALARAVVARDTAIGLAMMLAPMTSPLAVALLLRIASDLSDAAVFGLAATDRTSRLKVSGIALGWALLNAIALWAVLT